MAKEQKSATLQEPAREDLMQNRPDNIREFYKIVNQGFASTEESGEDRKESEAVEGAEEEPVTPEDGKGEETTEGAETTEAAEEAASTEEPKPEVEPEPDETEYADVVELADGTQIPVEDLEMMSKVFRDKEGKPLPIKDIVDVYNAGKDPVVFLRKGNEIRATITKDIAQKSAIIASLEQQIDALTQEVVESRRARVVKPNATLLDSDPAAYNAQLLAYVDSKGETDSKVAEIVGRRQAAQTKLRAEVNEAWDGWHKESENAVFLKNLSPQEREQFEAGVTEVLQDSYRLTGILMPMAVPMQYTIAKLQWERQLKTDNLAGASLSGAQAEQRKRMRIVKAAKSQISRGAITTTTSKGKGSPSSPALLARLRKAASGGDDDEANKILREARFGE